MIVTELDALLDRVREDRQDPTGKNRNAVAYDCWRMFEDLATRFKEEFAARDRYKAQSNSWRDKALELAYPWRPIEAAPKEGRTIFIWYGAECVKGAYLGEDYGRVPQWYVLNRWRNWEPASGVIKFWMPLPEPPSDPQKPTVERTEPLSTVTSDEANPK